MKKLFMIASFFAAFIANGQAVDTLSLYVIGANGRLVKADTGITNIIQPYRSANTIKYRLNINGIFHGVSTDTDFVARQKQVIPNFKSNVLNGTATPPNLNGTLYNIINDVTFESATWTPVTTFANGSALVDSNVDGTLINKVNGIYYKLTKQFLTVKDFGAKGDGTTDDWAAIQKAINVCSYWGYMLYATTGTFVFSQTLNLPLTYVGGAQTAFTVNIVGSNTRTTVFKYTGTAGYAITAMGGAGQVTKGGISNITISGNTQTTALVYVAGRCGFTMRECEFGTAAIARLLHNPAPGTFTEYCVNYNCVYDMDCKRELEYRVGDNMSVYTNGYMYTSGGTLIDVSFNGSGEVGATVNSNDTTSILIGRGCLPYGAPLSFHNWVHTPHFAVINNQSTLLPYFVNGSITTESFTSPTTNADFTVLGIGNRFFFQGSLAHLGGYMNGTLYRTDYVEYTQASAGNLRNFGVTGETYSTAFVTYDTIRNVGNYASSSQRFGSVEIAQSNYLYHCVIAVRNSGTNFLNTEVDIVEEVPLFRMAGTTAKPQFLTSTDGSILVKMVNDDGTLNTVTTNISINFSTIAVSKNNIQ